MPERLFILKFKTSKPILKFDKHLGRLPTKLLLDKIRIERLVALHIDKGIFPAILLFAIEKKSVKGDGSGSGPSKLLSSRRTLTKLVQFLKLLGIEPVKLFASTVRFCSNPPRHKFSGKEPVNRLVSNCSTSKFTRSPKDPGIEPES